MTLQLFISALVLGLLSSFHCVGMCGAIAFSVPAKHLEPQKKVIRILLYNLGRITTYALLGVVFGIAGRQIYLGGLQQWFSIIAGCFIIGGVVQSFFRNPFKVVRLHKINLFVQKMISTFLRKQTAAGALMLGVANGLLPCGLVYLAITGALAAGTIRGAAGFMIGFGLGTFPALFILSYFGVLVSIVTRNTIRRVMPFIIGLMGLLLIVRGMGLGVPYISPVIANPAQRIIGCH